MLAASIYIITCSARNRLRVRLRRLREPRYLIGGIVGAAYFYFSFFARARSSRASAARRAARGVPALPPAVAALVASGPAIAGLALLVMAASSWIVPVNSGLLDFSEAEMQFLFTAPISRRQLLIHRLLRSQLGLLFASIIIGVATPSVAGYTRLRISVAMWVLLITAKTYFMGVTLSRKRLLTARVHARRFAWAPVGLLFVALMIVIEAVVQAVTSAAPSGLIDVLNRVGDVSRHGAAHLVLWPFMALAGPLFAAWPQPYFSALAAACVVFAASVGWMLQSDEALQEAATEAAERRAAEPATRKAGYRVRSSGWTLAPMGSAEGAFAWKAATQTVRVVDRRVLARIGLALVSLSIIAMVMGRANGLATTIGLFATVGAVFSVLMVPQALRLDMRQDLRHLEVLKTWPVAAPAVLRGELLWPGALITAMSWSCVAFALLLSGTVFPQIGFVFRVSAAAAIAIIAPALVFAQLTIHNGVALIFPAWVPLGSQRPRGLDAMGQRLIMLTATWLLLLVMILPGAVAGGIIWFAFARVIGATVLVPAALVCAAIVAIEVLLATEALGPAYERLDIMAVERGE